MNYIVVTIFLFFLTGYSQENVDSSFVFSKYEHFDLEKKGDKIRDILNEDKEALIINLDNSKYISLKNNEINCYTICKDTIINIIKLNKIDAMNCKKLIDTLALIEPSKITNEIDKEGNRMIVQDGVEYEIFVYKQNKILKLYSYSPDSYMEDIFPFAEDRKSFLYSYLNLTKYFYDKEFERVKSLDTIYLYFKRGRNIRYVVDIDKLKNKRQENYYFNFNCSSGQFINLNLSSSIEPTNTFYKKKSFLKTNSGKILYSDYLQKFTGCDLEQLINSNMKKVFIIDEEEIRKGKIKIKEVRGGTMCL